MTTYTTWFLCYVYMHTLSLFSLITGLCLSLNGDAQATQVGMELDQNRIWRHGQHPHPSRLEIFGQIAAFRCFFWAL